MRKNFPDKVRETAPPTPLTESQQISPNRVKNGVCVFSKVKNGPNRPKTRPKRAKIYEKGVFGPKIPVFIAIFLAEFWYPPFP